MAMGMEEIEALLGMNIYGSREEVIRDALRALMESKPQLKAEVALYFYKNGEVSLWKAAEIAGMTLEEFKEILSSRGVKIEAGGTKAESKNRISRAVGD